MSIETTQTTITIQNDDGSAIKIGEIQNVSGISASEFKKIPNQGSFKADLEIETPEDINQLMEQLRPIEEKRIGRLVSESGDTLEGELQSYAEKQKHCTRIGAKLIAPKRIIDGESHETGIDEIDFTIGTYFHGE